VAFESLLCEAASPLRVFYDLDTPVTLAQVRTGRSVAYLAPHGLAQYELVLSFTGGGALAELETRLGAPRTAVLYGSVDPSVHGPVPQVAHYRCDLSYLGTYADDRQPALEALLIAPARAARDRVFLIGGAQYPESFPWTENMSFVRHVPPADHAAFYASSRFTLNVTRKAMADMGYCPSGRLFEAAACGTPIVTDVWPGLERFFAVGEVVVAHSARHVLDALDMDERQRLRIARAARERVLEQHTADRRALELERALEEAYTQARGARLDVRERRDHVEA
jgi:spore maturation protein CgeB